MDGRVPGHSFHGPAMSMMVLLRGEWDWCGVRKENPLVLHLEDSAGQPGVVFVVLPAEQFTNPEVIDEERCHAGGELEISTKKPPKVKGMVLSWFNWLMVYIVVYRNVSAAMSPELNFLSTSGCTAIFMQNSKCGAAMLLLFINLTG